MEETRFEKEILEIEDTLREMWNHTDDEWFQSRIGSVSNSMDILRGLYDDALEKIEKEKEKAKKVEAARAAQEEKEEFMLHYTRLVGLAEQFTALGHKRPESTCNAFKAQQVNRVLLPLRELTEEDMGLVSEEGEQSYSDVSLLLRAYMDLCSHFALRRYDLKYDIRGREIPSERLSYGRR